jgi:hypothetical protein
MATIFVKNPASGDACIVLEPRERFAISFDFKNDWEEIKMGAFVTMTTAGQLNELPITESVYAAGEAQFTTNHTFVPQNVFSFGFKDNSNKLPLESGVLFAGFMLPGIQTTHVDNSYSESSSTVFGGTANTIGCISGSTIFGSAAYPNSIFQIFGGQSTGNSSFSSFASISIRRTNGYSGIVFFNNAGGVPFTDVSLPSLRRKLNTSNPLGGQIGSGWFPPELNTVFIYSPFSLNRLRIHCLVVEKYR